MKSVFNPLAAEIGLEMWLPQSPTWKQMGLIFITLHFQGGLMMFWGWVRGTARSHFLKCCQPHQWDKEISDLRGCFLAEAKTSMSGRKFPLFTEEFWLTLKKGKIWACTVCPETCLRGISQNPQIQGAGGQGEAELGMGNCCHEALHF